MPLDIEQSDQLIAYLQASGRCGVRDAMAMHVLAGGVSNRTVLVEGVTIDNVRRDIVLKQALPKLRVDVDWFSDPTRVHREALGLRWLCKLLPAGSVPGFVFEDKDNHLLAMTAVPTPHENYKRLLLAGHVESDHAAQFGRLAGTIHRTGYRERHGLSRLFADRSFFESLRIEPYYAYTATQVPEAGVFMQALIADARARRITLVHGDFSPKNILVHQNRLVLIDHEVIHWGDPAFDIGFASTHLLSKAHHMAAHRAALVAAAKLFWSEYVTTLGASPWTTELEPMCVRHTLACLLARVAGRSKLEYLATDERARQRDVVTALMHAPPATMDELIDRFVERV